MKNLIVVLVLLVSGIGFGQDTIVRDFDYFMDSIANETELRPTYKTGDNDIILKGVRKVLFSDTSVYNLFRQHYSLKGLYVGSKVYGQQKMIFSEWFEKHIVNSPYKDNDEYILRTRHTEEHSVFYFIDASDQETIKRVITFCWDNTNTEMEIEFGNLRYISDSVLNTN